ncbi:hypothetical protein [Asticcacaulis sp.]|uniref:hypothetical protein n=1 Tax=Asticcacaulis sp. TaxID=1872648 RepID=UPI003F7CD323
MLALIFRFILIAGSSLILSGCNHIGLCTEEQVDTIDSPTGHYQAEVINKDCVWGSPVQEVFLRRTEGLMNGRTAVAIFDSSNPHKPVDLAVKWRGEHRIVITAHGAKVWSFQPNWRDVRVMER